MWNWKYCCCYFWKRQSLLYGTDIPGSWGFLVRSPGFWPWDRRKDMWELGKQAITQTVLSSRVLNKQGALENIERALQSNFQVQEKFHRAIVPASYAKSHLHSWKQRLRSVRFHCNTSHKATFWNHYHRTCGNSCPTWILTSLPQSPWGRPNAGKNHSHLLQGDNLGQTSAEGVALTSGVN